MNTQVQSGVDGRKKIIDGVNIIANAVKVTLGASGRNVIIRRQNNYPHITKDGVTVAKSIELEDLQENMGASLIKEVAGKTVELCGDGTTTATILAQSLITKSIEAVDNKSNPLDLKRGIEKGVEKAVEIIKSLSKEVSGVGTLKNIATISANNDAYIGELIAGAIEKIGEDGLITVEASDSNETVVNVVTGMKQDRGYMSPYFVTDTERMITEFSNPLILLYDKKITHINSILKILEEVSKKQRSIFIICEDIDGGALSTMVTNRAAGRLSICAVKCPGFGENKKNIMQDIAILTGASFITEDAGKNLESATIEMLGTAESVLVTNESFSIVGGGGKEEEIQKRCDQIKVALKTDMVQPEKDKMKDRLAKLASGVAVIKVGGITETEITERKDRIDDAVAATLSAKEQGYVAGGGIAYLQASFKITMEECQNEDEEKGMNIVKEALQEPFKQILSNGGQQYEKLIEEIRTSAYGIGYNIKKNVKEDLFIAGVIDPTKVIITALQNAASIAGVLLTTECVIF